MSDNLETENNNQLNNNQLNDNNYSRNLFIGSNIFSFIAGLYCHYLMVDH